MKNCKRPLLVRSDQNDKPELMDQLKIEGQQRIKIAIHCLSIITVLQISMAWFKMRENLDADLYIPLKIIILVSCIVTNVILKYFPKLIRFAPFIIMLVSCIAETENIIMRFPQKPTFPVSLLAISASLNYSNSILLLKNKLKNIQQVLIFGLFFLRCYSYYGNIDYDIFVPIVVFLLVNNANSEYYDSKMKKMSELYLHKQELSNEKFNTTFEFIPQGIIVISLADKNISFSNSETLKMLQISNEGLIIEQLQQYYHKEKIICASADIVTSESYEAAKSNNLFDFLIKADFQSNQEADYIFKNKNYKKHFQVKATLINQNTQVIAVLNDITRIKQLESQSQKMKSMYFASVAHELKTPLNSIIPMTHRLQTLAKNDEHTLTIVMLIQHSAIFLQNIIDDALDMSRLESNKFELINNYYDLRVIVKEVTDIMDFQVKQKQLSISVKISDNVPDMIYSDQKRYKQILFNLIGNAVKFTFKGYIRIEIDFIENNLVTNIIDTGIGIKQENINKLFRLFGQISDQKQANRGSIGLGLTTSKTILQQLNGEIQVFSQHERGSTFTFRFGIEKFKCYQQDLYSEESKEQNITLSEQGNGPDKLKSFEDYSFLSQKGNLFGSSMSEIEEDFASNKYQKILNQQKENHHLDNSDIISSIDTSNYKRLPQLKHRVLIADDSPYNIFVLQELLPEIAEIGEIDTALNGQQALDLLLLPENISSSKQSLFSFILIDLHMPLVDGFEAIRQLLVCQELGHIRLEQTKIIAVSAISKEQFGKSKHSELFDAFLEKPVNFDLLAKMLKN